MQNSAIERLYISKAVFFFFLRTLTYLNNERDNFRIPPHNMCLSHDTHNPYNG